MDKKVLAGIGIIAVGGIAVIMMSRSSAGPSMPGAGGGGAPPPETKKEGYGAPVYNITFGSPGGFGGFGGAGGFPDPVTTIADTLYPGDPAGHVYASTLLPGYHPPSGPTKKEQITGETGFTSRTGGGEDERWIGGR